MNRPVPIRAALRCAVAVTLCASAALSPIAASADSPSASDGLSLLRSKSWFLLTAVVDKDGRTLRPTVVIDRTKPLLDPQTHRAVLSESFLIDVECQAGRAQVLKRSLNSQAMGAGELIREEGPFAPEDIRPNSVYELLRSQLCVRT